MKDVWLEVIGYAGTGLILISMLLTSMVKLRIVNAVGDAIFATYAFLIHSYPTVLLNAILVVINVYQIIRLVKGKKHYDLVKTEVGDKFASFLISDSEKDICFWFPEFPSRKDTADVAFMVCHDKKPAGLFLGKLTDDGGIEVVIDYALPAYRDTTVSRFLYEKLKEEGYKTLVFNQNAPGHMAYLKKMGYIQNGDGAYELTL